jgi:hypothetical protein
MGDADTSSVKAVLERFLLEAEARSAAQSTSFQETMRTFAAEQARFQAELLRVHSPPPAVHSSPPAAAATSASARGNNNSVQVTQNFFGSGKQGRRSKKPGRSNSEIMRDEAIGELFTLLTASDASKQGPAQALNDSHQLNNFSDRWNFHQTPTTTSNKVSECRNEHLSLGCVSCRLAAHSLLLCGSSFLL